MTAWTVGADAWGGGGVVGGLEGCDGGAVDLSPPSSNTGVVDTSENVLLDYLRFTVSSEIFARVQGDGEITGGLFWLVQELGLRGDIVARKSGLMGYPLSAEIGQGGLVAFGLNGEQNGTVVIDLSGSALAYQREQGLSTFDLLCNVNRLGAKITRIDVAFDDRDEVVTYDRVVDHFKRGAVTTSAKKWNEYKSDLGFGEEFNPDAHGWTIEVGSRSSETFIRIYNKAVESGKQDEGHYVRVELELKGDKARKFVHNWLDDGVTGGYAASVLLGALDFKWEGQDSNKARWATAYWWTKFLDTAKKAFVRLGGEVGKTIHNVLGYVERQAATSIAMVVEVFGVGKLIEIVNRGRGRFEHRHEEIIRMGLDLHRGAIACG